MASPSPSMERRVAGDEDTIGGVRVADEAEMFDGTNHGFRSFEGEGSAGMESNEYDFQEDDTEHDHHAHNHHVLELRFSSMLPGHQRMSEAYIEQMNDMRKGGIGVSRIHSFMVSLAGGYHNVPYTTRDMHNVNAKKRREGGLDAESCLRYL
ncbi:hypothetical protein Ahy_A06g028519 [Arachis hypogaea]|uniref:Uncharacterized protein n=1 Tax=Arachis hypogaea TaxID=3818 RepID=A0A445CRB5_ARAHY|nr:hypothetical protein Ahy_A06g028519 [Arachis hypogaea]